MGEQLYLSMCHEVQKQLDPQNRRIVRLSMNCRNVWRTKCTSILAVPVDAGRMGDRPVVPGSPLEGLDQVPERRAVLLDITWILTVLLITTSMVMVLPRQCHAGVRSRESADARFLYGWRIQEILGNMHNLFGDTEAVDVLSSLTVV